MKMTLLHFAVIVIPVIQLVHPQVNNCSYNTTLCKNDTLIIVAPREPHTALILGGTAAYLTCCIIIFALSLMYRRHKYGTQRKVTSAESACSCQHDGTEESASGLVEVSSQVGVTTSNPVHDEQEVKEDYQNGPYYSEESTPESTFISYSCLSRHTEPGLESKHDRAPSHECSPMQAKSGSTKTAPHSSLDVTNTCKVYTGRMRKYFSAAPGYPVVEQKTELSSSEFPAPKSGDTNTFKREAPLQAWSRGSIASRGVEAVKSVASSDLEALLDEFDLH